MAVKEITNTGQAKSSLLLPTSAGWTQICDSLLVGTQASFDTNTILGGNIPGVYRHLKLFVELRTDVAAAEDLAKLVINNDTGANYDYQANAIVNNVNTNKAGATGAVNAQILVPAGSTAPAGASAQQWIDFVNYAGTTFNKRFTAGGSYETANTVAGQGIMSASGGQWRSTAAITRISIAPVTGTVFAIGSRFTLYGM